MKQNPKTNETETTTVENPVEAAAPELTPEQIAELQAEMSKAKENWIRTEADFQNFKKRAAREKTEAIQFANVALIQKLLPVLDNFEMAQAAAQNSADASRRSDAKAEDEKIASLQSGVAMIQQQLKSVLVESGLEEIDATGKPFDPTLHEAISQQESAEIPDGHVLQQIRKGYKLRERLLRPATVIVAKKPVENPK